MNLINHYDLALEEDLKGNYRGAIDLYSKSIENEELNLDAHLNLIVILIEVVLDYGVTSDLINRGVYQQSEINDLLEYLNSLIQKTEILFDSNEIRFWRYYKEMFYNGIDSQKVRSIIDQDKECLVPYFQLYISDLESQEDFSAYENEIQRLKELLSEKATIKNKYILSLINSAENLRI